MSAETYRDAIKEPRDHLILGLDDMTWQEAGAIIEQTSPYIGMAKINSLADRKGWRTSIDTISNLGMLTVADGMFHNTPKVVENHVRNVTELGAAFVTVHASGGSAMLEAAVKGRDSGRESITDVFKRSKRHLIGGILGVTVLTSLDNDESFSIYGDEASEKVLDFARMARDTGLDGIVCSAHELRLIREDPDLNELLVAVGSITPSWNKKQLDQKRTATPAEAMRNGADYLMLGRNVTKASDMRVPKYAASSIVDEVAKTVRKNAGLGKLKQRARRRTRVSASDQGAQ